MPVPKTARAEVRPRRQRTQYSCMACSMAMCLTANGIDADEDTVNEVMGAQPMRGAAWEQALACAQHYGMRATLTVPATLSQVKALTDRGVPVMIAWNPEGREWSHASVVVDVVPCETHGFMVHVADPNIPDPEQTVRVVTKDDFYKKWYEKFPNYLVRRPAMAVEREITQDGRQVMASTRTASVRTAEEYDCLKDYRAGTLSREEYYRCIAQMRAAERREREVAEKNREATGRARYHYVMYAERNGLSDVLAWLNELAVRHSGETMQYIPRGLGLNIPEDIRSKFYRKVFVGKMTNAEVEQLAQFRERHPGLRSNDHFMAQTDAYVLEMAKAEADRRAEEETSAAAREDVATEMARPYSVDPKYRRNWHHYTWADGDYPYEWRWNYIDDDGVYVHVSATVETNYQTKKVEIKGGRAEVVVYKFAPEEVRGLRRDTDESMIRGKAELVTRGVIRTRDPEEVIPRTMPFILKIKGERGFDDDDLESQAQALRERQRQEAEAAARAKAQAEEEARLQRQRKTVVDSALSEKFAILDQLIAGGFPQARDIAREVKSVYEAGGKPTEDQLKALRNMMYRSRMRSEADQFRVASSDLESAWWGDDVTAHTAKVKDTVKIKKEDLPKQRHGPEFVQNVMRRPGGGTHHTRTKDVEEGRSRKDKHRKDWADREADELTAAWGNT